MHQRRVRQIDWRALPLPDDRRPKHERDKVILATLPVVVGRDDELTAVGGANRVVCDAWT